MPFAPVNNIDALVAQVVTGGANYTLHELTNYLKQLTDTENNAGEMVLASAMQAGVDPLSVLQPEAHTILIVYILSARLLAPNPSPALAAFIVNFCQTFDPAHARYVSDRVKLLARGIYRFYEMQNVIKSAVNPLRDLLQRYPPSPAYLTNIHAIFVQACVASNHYTTALPILNTSITEIDKNISDLHYNDNLLYHYFGGIVYAALKDYKRGEEFLEIVVSSPAQVPASIQLEAYKKMALIQLIIYGETKNPPKYTHSNLSRLFKTIQPYSALIRAYPSNRQILATIAEKEANTYNNDGNMGLVKLALERAPRWVVRKLTRVYASLSLPEIGKEIGVSDEIVVRNLVLSMIEENEIQAVLSPEGTLSFRSEPESFNPDDIQKLLVDAQAYAKRLGELERELGKRPDFLAKALKEKEGHGYFPGMDDDMFASGEWGGRGEVWDE
jgi:COP9 signalosome complex subunit 3